MKHLQEPWHSDYECSRAFLLGLKFPGALICKILGQVKEPVIPGLQSCDASALVQLHSSNSATL